MNKQKKELEELKQELKLKIDHLEDKEARLNGGKVSPLVKREYMAIGKEIARMEKIIQMREIELREDLPITPKYQFETNSDWMELKRSFVSEELDQLKETHSKLVKQEEEIKEEISELTKRIEEIRVILGDDVFIKMSSEVKINKAG